MTISSIHSTSQTPLLPRSSSEHTKECCKAPSCTQIVNGIATASLAGYGTGLAIAQHKGSIENPLKDTIILSMLGLTSLITISKVYIYHYHQVDGDSMIKKGCKTTALTTRDTIIGAGSIARSTGIAMIAL